MKTCMLILVAAACSWVVASMDYNENVDCANGKQLNYRGYQSKTSNGKTCQEWALQYPQKHSMTPTNYPNAGLVANYCRNPTSVYGGAWCYTTGSTATRWDYCGVRTCPNVNVMNIDCANGKQLNYRGYQSKTSKGKTCQAWNSQYPQKHDKTPARFPNSGLVTNYCRNPTSVSGGAWCYTTDRATRWQFCGVQTCSLESCDSGKQINYRGDLSQTRNGVTCQAWASQYPQKHDKTPARFPNSGLVYNYCRNPTSVSAGAWCYTTGSKRWDYCNVPKC